MQTQNTRAHNHLLALGACLPCEQHLPPKCDAPPRQAHLSMFQFSNRMTFDVVTGRLPMPKNATQPNNVPADAPNTTCPARRVDRPAGAACEARLATDHDATANFHKYYPFGIFGRRARHTRVALCRNSRVFAVIRWRLSHNFHFARTHTFWGTTLFWAPFEGRHTRAPLWFD